ncbi:MAG: MotA/TolQ/ExbB proton channel family protein [Isosphaeraceae bacterium]
MARSAQRSPRMGVGYLAATGMLVLAVLFPIGLMIFNPTLMFKRGWEQYVGTAIYFWAVLTLSRELLGLWRNEQAFADAPRLLQYLGGMLRRNGGGQASPSADAGALASAVSSDGRILHVRVRQLVAYLRETHAPSAAQLMEVNREASGLDQENMAGRFTLTRYILYLLPVIGFIGTVEGISRALMNISVVLPLVKDLDAFLSNLTGVTSALQIAFDSTLLALFLSAALMLVQTLVYRKSEALLARVDGWVVEYVLPGVGTRDPMTDRIDEIIGPHMDRIRAELATILTPAAQALAAEAEKIGQSLKAPVAQLTASLDRFPASMAAFQQGAAAIQQGAGALSRLGDELGMLETAGDSLRRGAASLSRIETALVHSAEADPQLEEIKLGLDRATLAIESLSSSWSSAYEKTSRTTQEQLARTMSSLKDALELINVSMEQGNSLYRNIVKKMFDERAAGTGARTDSVRAA